MSQQKLPSFENYSFTWNITVMSQHISEIYWILKFKGEVEVDMVLIDQMLIPSTETGGKCS